MEINLAGIVQESVSDGPGVRVTVFFQGCEHYCPGCHNPQTWDKKGGTTYTLNHILGMIKDSPMIRGITLSGGEPFLQPEAAIALAREFHLRGKDVWIYTGFLWEDLLKNSGPVQIELLENCDVLVDGPFRQAERVSNLIFRGSANQRIISVKDSIENGSIVQWVETIAGKA